MPPSQPSSVPEVIGDYRVLDVLGSGGMGVVYRAQHVTSGTLAAVKTVRAATETTLESLRREIQMLRELRHPGVITILDHGVLQNAPWYAMELLRGRTLRDDFVAWYPERYGRAATTEDLGAPTASSPTGPTFGATADLRAPWHQRDALGTLVTIDDPARHREAASGSEVSSGAGFGGASGSGAGPATGFALSPRYSLHRIALLFRKICDSLAYVHGQGIIHRDLSPSNIFLVRDTHPVLFDFGLAAQVVTPSGRDVVEVGGMLRGTAHYMAPEQARGEIVDARADLYSLGCILYEALTGRPPFLGESPVAVLMRHVEDLPASPSEILSSGTASGVAALGLETIPPELDELVMLLLSKRPGDRIGYAEDVAARLLAVLEHTAGNARTQLAAGAAGTSSATSGDAAMTPSQASEPSRAGLVSRPRAYVYRAGLAGRTELIERLDRALLQRGHSSGGCAVLVGESGVGKTRLAGEVATRAHGYDVRVVVGECEPIGVDGELRGAPLHPLRPLLRMVADRCRQGGPAEAARLLGSAGGVLLAYEPALAGLVSPVEDRVDPATARFRVLAVLGDMIRALCRDTPILLVLDDLQWADELTLALLGSLGDGLSGLLVLGTVRAEERTPELEAVLAGLRATQVEVPRLSREAVGTMVRDMLALDDEVPALTSLIATRSEGNPWLVAEYVRAAVEEGALHRELGGRWQLREQGDVRFERLPEPGSVQALVHRRMQALSEEARGLAMAAAVLGRICDAAALSAITDRSAEEVRAALALLLQRQVLHELGDGQLRFAHDRLREHAYGELPALQRRELHRRAACMLEARLEREEREARLERPDRPERDARDEQVTAATRLPYFSELAMHWEEAAELPRAARSLEQAAEHALATAAFGEARSLLRRLLELPLVVESGRSARWDRWLGEACFALGDLPAAAGYAQQSLDQLGHSLPRSPLGWAMSIGAGVSRQLWRRVTGGRRKPRPADDGISDAALASARMTSYYFFSNDSYGLVGASLQAINLAERAGDRIPVAEIYAQLGYIAKIAKLDSVSRGYFARAHATALETRDASGLTWSYFSEAAAAIGSAQWDVARRAGREGLAIAESLRNPQDVEVAHTILGHCDFATGDYAAALASARSLYDSAHGRANLQHEAWGLYTQARAHLYCGRLDQARAGFSAAETLLEGSSDQASQILCGGMYAVALARAGQLSLARATAESTTQRIAGKAPPVFTIAEGFVGAAEAYLEIGRVLGRVDGALAAATERAIDDVARLAKVFPIAAPAAAWLSGLSLGRAGHRRRARRKLAQALELARAYAMPYDEAMAQHGLAQLEEGDAAATYAGNAARLFTRLGCSWHVAAYGYSL